MENQKSEQRKILKAAIKSKFDEVAATSHRYGKRFLNSTIDRLDSKLVTILNETIENIFKKESMGLFIMGGVGSGKTSFLYLLHKAIFERQVDNLIGRNYYADTGPFDESSISWEISRNLGIKFITHMGLISNLRKEPDDKDYLMANCLMLDDFGRSYEDAKGWNVAIQDEFFDYRWKNMLTTFLTSNYTPEDLRKMPGYERIVDRLGDKSWVTPIIMPGESKRKE